MADILIKNVEMPKEIQCCYTIYPNGKVIIHWDGKVLGEAKAIELPPHGTLKDTDAFLAEYAPKTTTIHVVIDGKTLSIEYPLKEILRSLFDAPTIVEANNGSDS